MILAAALNKIPSWFHNLPMWAQAGVAGGAASGGLGWLGSRSATVAAASGVAGSTVFGGGIGLAQGYFGALNAVGYNPYKAHGVLASFGFEAQEILGAAEGDFAGATRYRAWGGFDFDFKDFSTWRMGPRRPQNPLFSAAGIAERTPGVGGILSVGMGAYSVYSGYQEGGLSGAYDAFTLNTAVEASLYRWGFGVGPAARGGRGLWGNVKLAGHPLKLKTSTALLRGLGAGVGGYIGQSIGLATGLPMAGTLGAAAGAYIGGSPLGAMKANPILVGGALAVTGAAALSYGAYSVVKTAGQMGYAHRQGLRGVNTDGSMASFMTQNAITMRERSVQAIAKSHLNARSALGQEANFMHSPRNYNSRYR